MWITATRGRYAQGRGLVRWGAAGWWGAPPLPVVGGCFVAVALSTDHSEVVVDDQVVGGVGGSALVIWHCPAWTVEAVKDDPLEAELLGVVSPVAGVLLPPTPRPTPAPFVGLAAGFALVGWGDPSPTCFASSSCQVVFLGV
jgi:hypothetical protein